MSTQASLKDQNAWLIRGVLLAHFLAFSFIAFEPELLAQMTGPDTLSWARSALTPGSLSLAVIVLAKLVLLGLVPSKLRDRLIHWHWRHPLPGSRAFTKLGPDDNRVDIARLESIYGPLPYDPAEQDRMFYRIYLCHRDDVGVLDAHRAYLAARDIGILNLILLFLLPGLAWWATDDGTRAGTYATALLLAYVLTAFAAQRYAIRMVENTLAVASTKT
ncbi:hypothetical protein [Billgrantia desiderata]|uniref:hypothetical protein n=1 Tax=Billgrantia desiderata TaxID=52021 RepID=UPI001123B76F|nr:hypothetical protein [Halomonas desiderata]